VQDIGADIRSSRGGVPCYLIIKAVGHIAHESLPMAMTSLRSDAAKVAEVLTQYSVSISIFMYYRPSSGIL
jgi:hypothetical protein